ncbi:MAG: transmembrane anchor protein [Bosea sp.]|uniref:transmembrane anchor protein n=1 Tax=Bosea sp. (in: a-proteobacteria) TaxID=1871050 RepID=UPI001E14976C|nr:transmembrane anchor protein [Beijerinckiaceae bacterium]MCP4564136.1 transmembrane anchor protein [Bosea sp. (in: a-proteobacteria)]MCP4739910.1 transmembrane anchor protein [Bosea sp. (in: a-proteobacteria)]
MYNTDIPTRAELPSSAQLLRSTAIAIVTAAGILVTIVLPAEYAIDPTGIGRMLKLTEMGEIKTQLATEAEADRLKDGQTAPVQTPLTSTTPDRRSSLWITLAGVFVTSARAGDRIDVAQADKTDETVITLEPTKGVEYKLTMAKGAQVTFDWSVKDGVVNYDMHGTPGPGAKEKSYKTGRAVAGDTGVLTAEFDGGHGWFWRNRGTKPVTITLRTKGAYAEIKRMS